MGNKKHTADMQPPTYIDHQFVDSVISSLKFRGIFDKFRKDCSADVDTKPAYQNLTQRVKSCVASFLEKQVWKPDLSKNQLRDNLRKYMNESTFLTPGIQRIVEQVVNPKVFDLFYPEIEGVVCEFLGLEDPNKTEVTENNSSSFLNNNANICDELKYSPSAKEKVDAWKIEKDASSVTDYANSLEYQGEIDKPDYKNHRPNVKANDSVSAKSSEKLVKSSDRDQTLEKKQEKQLIRDNPTDKSKDKDYSKNKLKPSSHKSSKDTHSKSNEAHRDIKDGKLSKDSDKSYQKDGKHKSNDKVKSDKDRQKSKDDHGSHKKKSTHSDKKPDRDRDGKGSSSKHDSHKSSDKHRSSSTHHSKSSSSKDDKSGSKDRKSKTHSHGSTPVTTNESKKSSKHHHHEYKSDQKVHGPYHERVTDKAKKEISSPSNKTSVGEEGGDHPVARRHSDVLNVKPDHSGRVASIPEVSIMELGDSKQTSASNRGSKSSKTDSSTNFRASNSLINSKVQIRYDETGKGGGGDEPPASNFKLKSTCENENNFDNGEDNILLLTAMYAEGKHFKLTDIFTGDNHKKLSLITQQQEMDSQQLIQDHGRLVCSYHDNLLDGGLYEELLNYRSQDYDSVLSIELDDLVALNNDPSHDSDKEFIFTSRLSEEEVKYVLSKEGELHVLESQEERMDTVCPENDSRRQRKINTRYLSDEFAITSLKRKLSTSPDENHSSKTYKKMCPPSERRHEDPLTPPYSTNSQCEDEDDDLDYSANNSSGGDSDQESYDYTVVKKPKLYPKFYYGSQDIIIHFHEDEVVNIELDDPKKCRLKHFISGLVLDGNRDLINLEIFDNSWDSLYSSADNLTQRGGGDADSLMKGLEIPNSINGKNNFIHHQC